MVEITVQVSENLTSKSTRWLSTILELSLIPFETKAATVANEIIRYLLDGPTLEEVIGHRPSEAVQTRLKRLIALNQSEMLSTVEQRELDELDQIEHIMRMTKLRLIEQSA